MANNTKTVAPKTWKRTSDRTPEQFAEWAAMTLRAERRLGGAFLAVDFGNGPLCETCAPSTSIADVATFLTTDHCYNCKH
jgi:hypothetical protein